MTTSGSRTGDSPTTTHQRGQSVAGRAADTVQETASRVADHVQAGAEKLGVTGNQSDTLVGQAKEQVSEQVSSRMDLGKSMAAESMSGVARALRQTGQHLRQDEDQGMLADYVDRGAEQIERFSGHLRHSSPDQLLDEVEAFARRQPMLFAGGAFALGLLAARFFRSQPPQTRGYSGAGGSARTGMYAADGRSTTSGAYGSSQPRSGVTSQSAPTPPTTPPNYSSTPGAGMATPGSAGVSAPGSSDSVPRPTAPGATPGTGVGAGQRSTTPQPQQPPAGSATSPSEQPTPRPGAPSSGATSPARPGETPAGSTPNDRTPPPSKSGSGSQRNF